MSELAATATAMAGSPRHHAYRTSLEAHLATAVVCSQQFGYGLQWLKSVNITKWILIDFFIDQICVTPTTFTCAHTQTHTTNNCITFISKFHFHNQATLKVGFETQHGGSIWN